MTHPGPYHQPRPAPPPDRSSIQNRAILLIVAGALCAGMIPAIFGIIALVQMDTDPQSARTMNKVGMILLIIIGAIFVITMVISFGLPLLLGLIAVLAALAGA